MTLRIAVLGTVATMALAGCSSSSGSSGGQTEAQVCAARATLSTSYQAMVADVKALNFGKAKDDLAAVKTAAADLGTAVQRLAAEKKVALQPEVTALTQTLQGLSEATTAAELGAGLDTAKAQFTTLLDSAATAASCS